MSKREYLLIKGTPERVEGQVNHMLGKEREDGTQWRLHGPPVITHMNYNEAIEVIQGMYRQ